MLLASFSASLKPPSTSFFPTILWFNDVKTSTLRQFSHSHKMGRRVRKCWPKQPQSFLKTVTNFRALLREARAAMPEADHQHQHACMQENCWLMTDLLSSLNQFLTKLPFLQNLKGCHISKEKDKVSDKPILTSSKPLEIFSKFKFPFGDCIKILIFPKPLFSKSRSQTIKLNLCFNFNQILLLEKGNKGWLTFQYEVWSACFNGTIWNGAFGGQQSSGELSKFSSRFIQRAVLRGGGGRELLCCWGDKSESKSYLWCMLWLCWVQYL